MSEQPWPLTPLMGRVLGAWYGLTATALLVAARTLRAPAEVPIPYVTLLVWTSLLALLPVVHADDLIGRDAALAAREAARGRHGVLWSCA